MAGAVVACSSKSDSASLTASIRTPTAGRSSPPTLGGLGLNLQAADVVINVDLPRNPAKLEQRIGRAHRIGQKKVVNVINLVVEDTIEERVLEIILPFSHYHFPIEIVSQ
jgi:superfamily II DNA/RNA helicase